MCLFIYMCFRERYRHVISWCEHSGKLIAATFSGCDCSMGWRPTSQEKNTYKLKNPMTLLINRHLATILFLKKLILHSSTSLHLGRKIIRRANEAVACPWTWLRFPWACSNTLQCPHLRLQRACNSRRPRWLPKAQSVRANLCLHVCLHPPVLLSQP